MRRTAIVLVLAASLGIAAQPVTAGERLEAAIQIWEPPAIQVFPDHDRVARDPSGLQAMLEDGRRLFEVRFNRLDGAGRPEATGDSKPSPRRPVSRANSMHHLAGPDANSCAGCHNQPAVGGSGDFSNNVFVGAHLSDPMAFDMHPEITSERNTISVFGAGAIETVAREISTELRRQRDQGLRRARASGEPTRITLAAKGIAFGSIMVRTDGSIDTAGLQGIDDDLVIRPFGAKGVAASLREFTLFALNQHHGIQAVERFGWTRTGQRDFDGDGVELEFTIGQTTALTLFQAALPAPGQVPAAPEADAASRRRGAMAFERTGCGSCHRQALPLASPVFSEPNPFNRPGAVTPEYVGGAIELPLPTSPGTGGVFRDEKGQTWVAAYTDFKRHMLCDDEISFLCNERVRQDNVPTELFLTAKLWDLATSAPYCHRGDCSTLSEAILHHGGEARAAREAFLALPDSDKRALIAFLLSLGSAQPSLNKPRGFPDR